MGKNALFDDYDGFVEKFKPKKTTDDCYTPPKVYDAVLAWVRTRYGIPADAPVVRPFWPSGDYEAFDYPPGCVVVDNPPFSIVSRISRFYAARGIQFFIFAPGLTMLNGVRGIEDKVGGVVVRNAITFENGAVVSCGFLTSLGENVLEVAPELDAAIQAALESDTPQLPKYVYPDAVISAAHAKRLCRTGVRFAVPRGEGVYVRKLDAQNRREIFGGGLLLTERAAAERAAAERTAAHVFELSPREREIQRLMADQVRKAGR